MRFSAANDPRFQRYNKNDDGKITAEELGIAAVFKAADKNGDGVISPDEFTAYMNSRRAGKQSSSSSAPQAAESVKPIEARYAETPGVEADVQSLDIYAPKGAENAPVMMHVHGGGWKKGDKRSLAAAPGFFNGQGFIFVSINYRLLPSGKHPNNVADAARAIAGVHDNIARYSGDPSQLFLYGYLAGAHPVALVATDERHLPPARVSLFSKESSRSTPIPTTFLSSPPAKAKATFTHRRSVLIPPCRRTPRPWHTSRGAKASRRCRFFTAIPERGCATNKERRL